MCEDFSCGPQKKVVAPPPFGGALSNDTCLKQYSMLKQWRLSSLIRQCSAKLGTSFVLTSWRPYLSLKPSVGTVVSDRCGSISHQPCVEERTTCFIYLGRDRLLYSLKLSSRSFYSLEIKLRNPLSRSFHAYKSSLEIPLLEPSII